MSSGQLDSQQASLKRNPKTILGSVVWWHVEGEYPRQTIDSIATRHGIKPIAKRTRASFTNALNEVHRKNPGLIAKRIKEDMTVVIYVIADARKKPGEKELEFAEQSWVAYDKMSDQVHWKERDPRIDEFAKRFDWYENNYTASDVRAIVEREICDVGVRLRSTGGVYFLSANDTPVAERVNRMLTDLGNDSHVTILAIPKDDPEALRSVQKDYELGAKTTLADINSKIDEILAAKKQIAVHEEVKLLKSLIAIEEEAESMEALLSYKATELRARIIKVRAAVKSAAKVA